MNDPYATKILRTLEELDALLTQALLTVPDVNIHRIELFQFKQSIIDGKTGALRTICHDGDYRQASEDMSNLLCAARERWAELVHILQPPFPVILTALKQKFYFCPKGGQVLLSASNETKIWCVGCSASHHSGSMKPATAKDLMSQIASKVRLRLERRNR